VSTTAVRAIRLNDIHITERLRALQPERVETLVASIADVGLLEPIVVRPNEFNSYLLIVGRHRVEAAKTLKWGSITATIIDGISADAAELAEIDENLVRAELTPAERVLHIGRRKELYEKIHPETKKGATGKYRQKSQVGTSENPAPAFIESIPGKSRAAVARDVARAKKVAVLADVVGTPLDQGAELDALAKLPEKEQRELAAAAKAGKKVTAKSETPKAKAKSEDLPFDLRNDDIYTLAPTILAYIGDNTRTRELANELLALLDHQEKDEQPESAAGNTTESAAGNATESAADSAERRKLENAKLADDDLSIPAFLQRKPVAS
jgi:hypothetical protein